MYYFLIVFDINVKFGNVLKQLTEIIFVYFMKLKTFKNIRYKFKYI